MFDVPDGPTIYFAGDTNVFGDMPLIAGIYEPDVAVLPIGDHFTMGPREAAVALELLGVERCVPCHYGTFPLLTGTPDELRELAPGRRGARARARGDDRAVRERWFGATGRRVPEIAVEGELDVEGALVLDGVDDLEVLRSAHERGRPVVVRRQRRAGAACARPARGGVRARPAETPRACSTST